jgi:hypothetical protein
MAWLLPSFLTSPFAQPLISKSGASANSSEIEGWPPGWWWGFSSPALKIPPRFVLSLTNSPIRCPLGPSLRGSLAAQSGRARGVGLSRRNNSTGWSSGTLYFRAERTVVQQNGHPTCAFANGSCRRPPHPSSETSRTIPSRNKERWRNSPPGGWAPGLRHPLPPRQPRPCLLRQHLQGPSDIAASGGAPRQATAWETEARSVAFLFAEIVNTEGPRP